MEGKSYDKQSVKAILEKDKLTFWDIDILFGYVFKTLSEMKQDAISDKKGLSVLTPISNTLQEDLDFAIQKAKTIGERIVQVEKEIYTQISESYKNIESEIIKHENNVRRLNERVSKIKVILPEVVVPYGYKEAIELSERMSSMSENQTKSLIEISKALINK